MKNKKYTLLLILSFCLLNLIPINIIMGLSLEAKDSDIRDMLAGIAKANGINLVMGNSVQGKVTITLNNVTPMEAIESILRANGFIIEKRENSYIAGKPEEMRKFLPEETKVISIKYTLAGDLVKPLSDVAGGRADISTDTRTNSLIITGIASAVQKLEELIKILDVEIPSKPEETKFTKIYKLKYAKASSLQSTISGLCSPNGKIIVDDRTNTLIITDKSSYVEQLASVIEQLDKEVPTDDSVQKQLAKELELHTRVFNLNHANALSVKDAIADLLSPNGKIQVFIKQKESAIPMQTMDIMGSVTGMRGRTSSGNVRLESQKWSDTLVVTDTISNIEKITELINKLDVKPQQVRIEAKMVEVTTSGTEQLGINWEAMHSPSGSTAYGDFPTNNTDGIELKIGTLSTKYFEDIKIKLQALETRGHAKLISNPSIMAIDNESAQIAVADRIPIPTIYETEFTSTASYDFISVGVLLTVTAQITEDGYIIMDVVPEVASIKEWTSGANPQPIISSRTARSRVRVRDGETFVIGGLMRDERHKNSAHIPLLGRIPLIGRLFGSTNVNNTKTELMIFITPQISKDK